MVLFWFKFRDKSTPQSLFYRMAYSAQEHILHPYFPCCTVEYDAVHSACHSSDPVLHFCNALHAGESQHASQTAVYMARIRHAATSGVEGSKN